MSKSRRYFELFAVAVIASIVTVSGPAIGHGIQHALFAHDSDKVDGINAVGSSATVRARKGKLVATSPTTGRLPANIVTQGPGSGLNADRVDGVSSEELVTALDLVTADGAANEDGDPVHWTNLKGIPSDLFDGDDAGPGGDITGITTGPSSGLTGGAASGDANLALTNCSSGQNLEANSAGTGWECSNYNTLGPLVTTGANNLNFSTAGCVAGEFWRFNGAGWTCDPETAYTAGTGLSLVGNQFNVLFASSGGNFGLASTVARSDHLHDDRYYTETELNSVGTINTVSNPVQWTKLRNVPAGFADGVDDNDQVLIDTDFVIPASGGACTELVGPLQITVPESGVLVLEGNVVIEASHANSTSDSVTLGFSTTSAACSSIDLAFSQMMTQQTWPAALPTATYTQSVPVQRYRPVNAGTHTYYLNGVWNIGADAGDQFIGGNATLTFIPN